LTPLPPVQNSNYLQFANLVAPKIQSWMMGSFHRPVYEWKVRQWAGTDAALRKAVQRADELRASLGYIPVGEVNPFALVWHAQELPYIQPVDGCHECRRAAGNGRVASCVAANGKLRRASRRHLVGQPSRGASDARRDVTMGRAGHWWPSGASHKKKRRTRWLDFLLLYNLREMGRILDRYEWLSGETR